MNHIISTLFQLALFYIEKVIRGDLKPVLAGITDLSRMCSMEQISMGGDAHWVEILGGRLTRVYAENVVRLMQSLAHPIGWDIEANRPESPHD